MLPDTTNSATRVHHTRCEAAKMLPCAETKGSECDVCTSQERVLVVPGRITDAVRRAAVSDSVLPSTFERNCGFAARGRQLFANPVFTQTHVVAQQEKALSMLQVMNSCARMSWHTRIKIIGMPSTIWHALLLCMHAKM